MTPEEAGRYADVEAVGKPSRNQFAGLSGRRVEAVRPVVEPWVPEGPELEAGPRPEWAAGGRVRDDHVRDEGGFLRGEAQRDGGGNATRAAGAPAPRLPGFDLPHVVPPMVSRSPGAGDGMDPADDALLRQTQRLLSTSLTFAGGPAEVAERLRVALLQAHPALMAALPGGPATQTEQLARALTWLVHHLDRPPLLVEGTGRLGAALAAGGVEPGRMHLVGAALAEAMRAGMAPGQWRQDFDLAWRSTWQHVYEWIAHGAARAAYDPPVWDATVVEHDLRRPDLAVVRLRPELPMAFRPGQFARVQVPELPAIWRPYSLAGAPHRNDLIELHVRAKTTTGVSAALVHRTSVGDRVRLSRAEGAMTLPETGPDLLMIAGDTGVAPLKALLTELADTDDPRSAVLFWGVRDLGELYDIDEIADVARTARRATVIPVVSEGDPGPYPSGLVTDAVAAYGEWSDHEVYLAGPPLMLAATSLALQQLGVSPERIHHDAPE
ncbi:FAD-binding oxidoreductase [Paractinoplanes maris]|uniref:FAD-binding oxidoreductase n=1 Tax=Paractinoplanes maris TaxID=1734446 RepID=UPI0020222FEE|nr:FAD-binding oxidoreductase [Actinoplanes maris]